MKTFELYHEEQFFSNRLMTVRAVVYPEVPRSLGHCENDRDLSSQRATVRDLRKSLGGVVRIDDMKNVAVRTPALAV